jgi:hypothetical protein
MSDTGKQDIVIVTPVYGPTMEELDRRFALHRLWEAKDRATSLRRRRHGRWR